MSVVFSRNRRVAIAAGLLAFAMLAAGVSAAQAQYANYFYYRNPRTGQSYTIGGVYSNGYGSYSGGFSYSAPGRYYSNSYGWGGGSGNRHYWGGTTYATPRYGYGNRWGW